jgi:integrase
VRKPLTQLLVEKIRPDPARRKEVPDHLYPQLRLVVQPTGTRSWAVRVRINGKPAKITLRDGLDLKGAREEAREMLRQVAAGEDPRVARHHAKTATLGRLVEAYLKHTAPEIQLKTWIDRERYLRRDWAPLHGRPISQIGKAEVAARLLQLKDEHPIAANRSRSTLRGLFGWAVDQGLVEANVVAATRAPQRREKARDRVLSPDERGAVWEATGGGSRYEAIVRLLFLLAQRRAEVAGMLWSEIDLDKALWTLPAARVKNGLMHQVPLSLQALDIIKAQPRRGERVFGAFNGFSLAKRRLDQRIQEMRGAPLEPWVLHDLRRSAATAMNDELGVAPHVVEAVLNHTSGSAKRGVAGVYNRALYLKERTLALQAWADHLTAAPAEKVVAFPAA